MAQDKNPFNSAVVSRAGDVAVSAIADVAYVPTPAQRELKAKFWEIWKDDPACDTGNVALATVAQIAESQSVYKLWKKPGFKEWFLNAESFVHKTVANGERGLEIIQQIMDDPEIAPSLRLKAAQISVDALAKLRDKKAVKEFADKALNAMDEDQLDKTIQQLSN